MITASHRKSLVKKFKNNIYNKYLSYNNKKYIYL